MLELTEKGFDIAAKNENLKATEVFNGLIALATILVAIITTFNFLLDLNLNSLLPEEQIVIRIFSFLIILIFVVCSIRYIILK